MKRRIISLLLLACLLCFPLVSLGADCSSIAGNTQLSEVLRGLLESNSGNNDALKNYIIEFLLNRYCSNISLPYCSPSPTQAPEATPAPTASPEENPQASPSPTPQLSELEKLEAELIELVNKERKSAGLNELDTQAKLTQAARVRAAEISTYFSHTRPNGTSAFTVLKKQGVSYKMAGENIASGYTSAQSVFDALMNSKGHRENIMNSGFTTLSVGVYKDNIGRLNWVQLFIA